ncbi:hydrolase [Flavobacterium sp. CYK-4]|uniref:DUF5916 domain-containing protein n=1 Tax=Flavobacterium lotistagni TaxID=2709660 RepID=UPI001408ED9A|nr:DUF5916 domain-containing protein [Flavobacterium lotistagni]NHM08132.1 hydrolase [Flavobacterium lotistagni]
MGKFPYYILIFICLFHVSYSQKKVLRAVPSGDITIDAKIDEPIWEFAPIAKDFIMFGPDNGRPIAQAKKTEVQVAYNDDGIYIAAKMYDDDPSKICKEITQRDIFGAAEHFGVFINGFNDSQQDFRFFVSSAGVQMDCIFTNQNGQDFTWDAIWNSKVAITEYGWVAEIKIPYAALRFSKNQFQTWGVNFYREIRRDRQDYTWNFIDSKINNESAQSGILEGIDNINTPTRLFLIPYSSFYLNANKYNKAKGELKGGLDIKYGISDAFTLDAILIPDFGQTKFDNVELNLSAFEQQFSENRPFFTEGTDLFSKGNLVYSRRIGQTPRDLALNNDEVSEELPGSIKLLNALKISGRNKAGLGIGVLNAVTEKTSVTVTNTNDNSTRNAILSPLTNYNVLVLDQRFRKNSSVSLINTSVLRADHFRDANVTGALFDLNTKANTYNLTGEMKYSLINENPTNKKGYNAYLSLGETSGNYRYSVSSRYISKDYNIDDLGITFQTHYHTIEANGSYRILNPNKTFNSFDFSTNLYSEFDNRTGRIQGSYVNLNLNSTNKKNDYLGAGITIRPMKNYDFYEPRTEGETRFVTLPEYFETRLYYSPNYNRRFLVDLNTTLNLFNEKDRANYGFTVSPRYRFSDRLLLIYRFNYLQQHNNTGYIDTFDHDSNPATDDKIIFARRNRHTYTNTLDGRYSVNNRMNFNLLVRHYWSYAKNHDILELENDGDLTEISTYTENKNNDFNTWNFDLSYNWWFAPGSQISVLYRNNALIDTNVFSTNFRRNVGDLVNNEQLDHIFSISFRYFIDYNSLKH